ncbi:hypothetical protein LUZ60_005026 [Juncus effusus]|nr:hypothetical protein LUZ60_005026 [Juncus effusus]
MSKPSRFSRIICAPIRALGRVRDFYVRSMTGCAGHMYHGPEYGYPAYAMSRSFSVTSDTRDTREEDLRELIRAASQSHNRSGSGAGGLPPRSRSVAVGRIDEDSPFDFNSGDDLGVGSNLLFPRSQSYATAGQRGGVFSRGV